MGSRSNRALRDSVLRAEREVAGKTVEHVIAYDALGNEILRKMGSVESIPLMAPEQKLLRRAVLVHNHPSERTDFGAVIKDIPPSFDDLFILLLCKVHEIRVITESHRFLFRAQSDPGFPTVAHRIRSIRQHWEREYGNLWKTRYNRLVERHGEPLTGQTRIDFYEGVSDDAHKAWMRIAKACRLYYRRELRK